MTMATNEDLVVSTQTKVDEMHKNGDTGVIMSGEHDDMKNLFDKLKVPSSADADKWGLTIFGSGDTFKLALYKGNPLAVIMSNC